MGALSVSGYKFSYKVKKYPDGMLAICNEIPAVDAFGQSEQELVKELRKAIAGYIETYPDKVAKLRNIKVPA